MRIIRFRDETGQVHLGEPIDDTLGRARLLEGDLGGDLTVTGATAAVHTLLAPVDPVNVIAIGLNYRRHAAESNAEVPDAPLIFAKLTSAVIASGEPIRLPTDAPDEVDYEAELAVVIGRRAARVTEEAALEYVLGYTAANDVSARDCQMRRDRQWTRAKSFDTFCPLGPAIVTDPGINPNALRIRGTLNGEVVQDSTTSDMIFPVPTLISYLSHQFTLAPGTVILTGTPEGVGFGRRPQRYLQPGDTFRVEVEGFPPLINPVEGAP